MVENGEKSWNCDLVLRPGVKSLKYKKIWLGGDPIATTQEFLDSSAIKSPFGHLKDFYDFMYDILKNRQMTWIESSLSQFDKKSSLINLIWLCRIF